MTENMAEQADRERAEREAKERNDALKAQQDAQKRVEKYLTADEFVVVAPYVTLKMVDPNGGPLVIRGFNEGGSFKAADVDTDNLRHHVETGLVAPKGSNEARFAGPAGTPKPGEPPNVPVTEQPVVALPLDERQRRQQEAAAEAEKTTSRSRSGPTAKG